MAVLATGIVDLPVTVVVPTELAPLDEAHVMQSVSDDSRIILDHMTVASARGHSRGQRNGGRGTREAHDTGNFNHRILPSLGYCSFWGVTGNKHS
ncbi:hypothetical protein HYPMC_1621 [Hyphomicrobium sp. MC1]|nr:hypothetical protein HYPMC_1621 [Hyphomicrobium sp. MC1]